jgi:hypothetical protein
VFVVACGDAPEILQAVEAAFDDIAAFVSLLVVRDGFLAVGPARDNCVDPVPLKVVAEVVGIVGFIGQEPFQISSQMADAFGGDRAVRDIAGRENDYPWPA